MKYIYIIKNKINDKVYIGQTKKSIEKRWNEHLKNTKTRNQLIYLAMNKYGIENFYIELLEEVPENVSLDEREIYYIKQYNSISPNGYNMIKGGSNFKDDNPMYHKEIAKKVSEKFIGDKNPAKRPEVRLKISEYAKNHRASEETKKKMSINNCRYWKDKKLPKETCEKISKNHWSRGLYGGLNHSSKKVVRIDKYTDEILQTYNSIKEACDWVKENIRNNAQASNISRVCHGRQKTAFGFKWKIIGKYND